MKLIGTLSTAVLSLTLGSLTLGVALPAYAQEQHDQQEDKDKPAQEKEKKAQPEKSAKPEDKNARQDENRKPEEKVQERAQPKPEEHAQARPEEKNAHAGRIPDDKFKANFGRQHSFRVSEGDYRNRRFQYGGYWFGFQSAWPSNWLYTQDVYVMEIDGVYYLCNPTYPGVNLALSFTL